MAQAAAWQYAEEKWQHVDGDGSAGDSSGRRGGMSPAADAVGRNGDLQQKFEGCSGQHLLGRTAEAASQRPGCPVADSMRRHQFTSGFDAPKPWGSGARLRARRGVDWQVAVLGMVIAFCSFGHRPAPAAAQNIDDFCAGTATKFKVACGADTGYTFFDQFVWKKCVKRRCSTTNLQALPSETTLSIVPLPSVEIHNDVNVTCRPGYRFLEPTDGIATSVSASNPRSWIRTCTRECVIEFPTVFCTPMHCLLPGTPGFPNGVIDPVDHTKPFPTSPQVEVYIEGRVWNMSCNAGYMSSVTPPGAVCVRSFNIQCQENGGITGQQCVPLKCDLTTLQGTGVSHFSVNTSITNSVDMDAQVTVFCQDGFRVGSPSGPKNASTTCMGTCEWNPEFPGCTPKPCINTLTTVANGVSSNTNPELSFGDTVSVTCNNGFRHMDQTCTYGLVTSCQDDGTLRDANGIQATSATCVSDPLCLETRSQAGKEDIAWIGPGLDSRRQAHLRQVGCGTYSPRPNFVVTTPGWTAGTTFSHGDALNVSCADGYLHSNGTGPMHVPCINGEFNEYRLGTCNITCPPIPNSNHDPAGPLLVDGQTLGEAPFQSISCNTGYRLADASLTSVPQATSSASTTTCLSSGQYDRTCVRISCDQFVAAGAGSTRSVQQSNPLQYGDIAVVSCAQCLRVVGSSGARLNFFHARCEDGAGSDMYSSDFVDNVLTAECTEVPCPLYELPLNSTVTDAPDGWTPTTTLRCGAAKPLTVTCNTGYVKASGTDDTCTTSWEVSCLDSGQLDGQAEFCEPQRCPPLSLPAFDHLTGFSLSITPDRETTLGEEVVVVCQTGYRATANALQDGSSCDDPGSFVATCAANCGYQTTEACLPVVCSLAATPTVNHNPLQYPFRFIGQTAELNCTEGHRWNTQFPGGPRQGTSTCSSDCEFFPPCRPVVCDPYQPPAGTNIGGRRDVIDNLTFGAITVNCDGDLIADASVPPSCPVAYDIKCTDSGGYSGLSFCRSRTCDCPGSGACVEPQISCGMYLVPPNAQLVNPNDASRQMFSGDKILLRCNTGYMMDEVYANATGSCQKEAYDSCTAIGSFNSNVKFPVCVPVLCPVTKATGVNHVPDTTVLVYGDTITQTCNLGYVPNPSATVVGLCEDNCRLSSKITCTYSECPMFNQFDYTSTISYLYKDQDGSPEGTSRNPIDFATTLFGEVVVVECEDDSMLSEEDFRTSLTGVPAAFANADTLGFSSLPAPTTGDALEMTLSGSFGSFTMAIPKQALSPGAPELPFTAQAVSVTQSIRDLFNSAAAVAADLRGDGTAVFDLGPEGVTFRKSIRIDLPFDTSKDYTGRTLKVHKYDTNLEQWVARNYPANEPNPVDFDAATVAAAVDSFSLYFVISFPTPPEASTSVADFTGTQVIDVTGAGQGAATNASGLIQTTAAGDGQVMVSTSPANETTSPPVVGETPVDPFANVGMSVGIGVAVGVIVGLVIAFFGIRHFAWHTPMTSGRAHALEKSIPGGSKHSKSSRSLVGDLSYQHDTSQKQLLPQGSVVENTESPSPPSSDMAKPEDGATMIDVSLEHRQAQEQLEQQKDRVADLVATITDLLPKGPTSSRHRSNEIGLEVAI